MVTGRASDKMATPNEDIISAEQLAQRTEDYLSITDDGLKVCANCGKEGTHLNKCNKCKAATYCNASCKKKHRSKHKKECERRVAGLHEEELKRKRREAELHDEQLFKRPPPPKGDCPICMLLLPSLIDTGYKYRSCCGKTICSGCIHAVEKRDVVGLCPFCRTPAPNPDGLVEHFKKRMELGDAHAIYGLGCFHDDGMYGFPQDHVKALELYHRAKELGHALSYYGIGAAYYKGNGVERDEKKAVHYTELAAMRGVVGARHNLGCFDWQAGNMDRALKHFMIAVGFGHTNSLNAIRQMYKDGKATKDDYAKALQEYQANLGEIKSPQRDEAAAFHERYKYY